MPVAVPIQVLSWLSVALQGAQTAQEIVGMIKAGAETGEPIDWALVAAKMDAGDAEWLEEIGLTNG